MLINFNNKINKKDFANLCPHEKSIDETSCKDYFQFKIICNTCNYVTLIRSGKLILVKTFVNNLSVTVYDGLTVIRDTGRKGIDKWVPHGLVKDDFDLTEFNQAVSRRLVLI